ncbi:MAG TPA: METTL5 family protein [Candidatus Methanomethylicus sp.]|nr:METTL5 family protein [Candidatus Methanomethylicus sp.]
MMTSKSELEIALERVGHFSDPKIRLEQYRLPAPQVAEILWYIGLRHRDIEGRAVADLGSGTGMFAIGAALMGADVVVGIDLDVRAVESARETARRLGVSRATDFVEGDAGHPPARADVVIQNPPFGVRVREADRAFLRGALECAPTTYSLHKGGQDVRGFIAKYTKELGGRVDEILPLKIKLPPTYHFHKKRFHAFDVDLYRIVRD